MFTRFLDFNNVAAHYSLKSWSYQCFIFPNFGAYFSHLICISHSFGLVLGHFGSVLVSFWVILVCIGSVWVSFWVAFGRFESHYVWLCSILFHCVVYNKRLLWYFWVYLLCFKDPIFVRKVGINFIGWNTKRFFMVCVPFLNFFFASSFIYLDVIFFVEGDCNVVQQTFGEI